MVNPTIAMFADSHGRGMAELLKEQLGGIFTIDAVVVKPSAIFSAVNSDFDAVAGRLSPSDFLVIMGGTNDILQDTSNNPCVIIHSFNLDEILNSDYQCKVIIVEIPPFFYENQDAKIKAVNRRLFRAFQSTRNVLILRLQNFKKSDFVQGGRSPGLHFNQEGKRKFAEKLGSLILGNWHESTKGEQKLLKNGGVAVARSNDL